VYIMEKTINELMMKKSYIVNITEVNILSYSSDPDATPEKANIVGIDDEVLTNSKGTSFNLLSDFSLKITEQISSNPGLSTTEINNILSFKYTI
jgi:hypothetical protein